MTTLDELQERIGGYDVRISEDEAKLKALPEEAKAIRQRIANMKRQRASVIAEMRKALPAGIVRTRKARAATTT